MSNLERHILSPTHMALGEHVQAMRGDVIRQLDEKHRIRQMLLAHPIGREALFLALYGRKLLNGAESAD